MSKERPILFSGDMVKAILAGRKWQTRRVMKLSDVAVYNIHEDAINLMFAPNGEYEHGCGTDKRSDIEADSNSTERRLYGGVGRSSLLTDTLQGIWEKGVRGLVSVKGSEATEGLPYRIYVPSKQKGDNGCPPIGLYGVSWGTRKEVSSSKAFGRQSVQQYAGQFGLGDTSRELAGQAGAWDSLNWGESSDGEVHKYRTRAYPLGDPEQSLQSQPRRETSWRVGGLHIRYCEFQPGMRLWVRETFAEMCRQADPFCWCDTPELRKEHHYYEYRADTGNPYPGGWGKDDDDEGRPVWKPSIFMPRAASRILLEVAGVRVERVQDITEADAKAEGYPAGCEMSPIDWFMTLWDSINAKRGYGWNRNPFNWVVDYKRIANEETAAAEAVAGE